METLITLCPESNVKAISELQQLVQQITAALSILDPHGRLLPVGVTDTGSPVERMAVADVLGVLHDFVSLRFPQFPWQLSEIRKQVRANKQTNKQKKANKKQKQ